MTETATMQIAKTIISQINYADRSALLAWGASNFLALQESKEFQGGVSFKVNGLVFKGEVKIELRWVDDYTVSFVRNGKTIKQYECVYCDMLVDIIDYIEGK